MYSLERPVAILVEDSGELVVGIEFAPFLRCLAF